MRVILLLLLISTTQIISAFSLKDKIVDGKVGDYVVIEQGGISSVLFIRSLSQDELVLEEVDVPSLQRPQKGVSWKDWIAAFAPGHTAWVSYTLDLTTNRLKHCYSYSQRMGLPTQDPSHFLPCLFCLTLNKTPEEIRKRVGPPPFTGEPDQRSLWRPSVIFEGKKIEQPSITAWITRWPADDSIISECEIELYFSSPTFPVWIEVRSPHYKASLRAADSGCGMISPQVINNFPTSHDSTLRKIHKTPYFQ